MRIMEKKMETTILGLYEGYMRIVLGLYKDDGKESGNYYFLITGHSSGCFPGFILLV